MNFSDYIIENGGTIVCDPCLTISLFSNIDLSPPGSPSVMGPFEEFVKLFGDCLTHCRLSGGQMHFRRVTAESLRSLPNQMGDDKRRRRGGIVSEFMSGRSGDEYKSPAIDFYYINIGRRHTALRAYFPLPWFDRVGLGGIQSYLESALKGFPLQSGYVGYSFKWDNNLESLIEPYLFNWLKRHPGLMEPIFSHRSVSHHGLTDIGWMTLLGKEYVERMGGAESLNQAAASIDGVHFEELPLGGLAIRLGNSPRLGDSTKGDPMDDYRALGRILAPLRDKRALHDGMAVAGFSDRDDPGMRVKWIDRFFPD